MRILTTNEIEAVSTKVDFALAGGSMITTADIRPIDMVAGKASSAAEEAMTLGLPWPIFEFIGALSHPPVPESMRKYVDKKKWEGYDEPVSYAVRGVEAQGKVMLFFSGGRIGEQPRSSLWGADQERGRLIFRRELDLGAVSEIGAPGALASALASFEGSVIDKSCAPGESAPKTAPRI